MNKFIVVLLVLIIAFTGCNSLGERSPEDQAAVEAFERQMEKLKCKIPNRFLEQWALRVTGDNFSYNNTIENDTNIAGMVVLDKYCLWAGYGFSSDAQHKFSYNLTDMPFNPDTNTFTPVPFVRRFGLAGDLIDCIRLNKADALSDLITMSGGQSFDVLIAIPADDESCDYIISYNVLSGEFQLSITMR